MSDVFVWDGNIEQTYGPEYGTQTLQTSGSGSFSRTEDLRIAAPNEALMLQPIAPDDSIIWAGNIVITDGTLLFDGQKANSSLYSTSNGGGNEGILLNPGPDAFAVIQFVDLKLLSLGTGLLAGNSFLLIKNPQEGAFFFGSIFTMKGTSKLHIDVLKTYAPVQADENEPFDDGFLLSDNAELIVRAQNLEKFAQLNISTKDSANVVLQSKALGAREPAGPAHAGSFITLSEGNARVSIQRLPGGDPVDLTNLVSVDHSENPFTRGFNFVGNAATNTSVLTLDFAYTDESGELQNGNNGFGRSWLWKNNLVSVNGVPQNTASKLRFDVDPGKSITIKFG